MNSHSRPPFAASLPEQPFFRSAQSRASLAREQFFGEGRRPSGLVPEAVIQSWLRCQSARRHPAERVGFDPVTPSRVRSAQQRSRALLSAAHEQLAQLESTLGGTGCRAFLTDCEGIIVHSTPAADAPEPVLGVAGRVGVSLSEPILGTTAPGVVLRTGQACTVMGGEHFFDACESVRCAAAPIRNRQGKLAGVLDLSTEAREFAFDAAVLVGLYAAAIENRLLQLPTGEGLLLKFQANPSLLGTPMEALAGVDSLGRLAWVNGIGQRLLASPSALGRPVEDVFGLSLEQLLDLTRVPAHAQRPQRLSSGLGVWIQAQLQTRAAPMPVPIVSSLPTDIAAEPERVAEPTWAERERRHVLDTLARCGGNVSRAARALGVSRGLLYRRLAKMEAEGTNTAAA